MGALIVGQAMTIQNMQGMDHLNDDAEVGYCRPSTWYNNLRNIISPYYNAIAALLPAPEAILNSSSAKVALPLAFTYLFNEYDPLWRPLHNIVLLGGATVAYSHIHRAIEHNQPITLELVGQGLSEGTHCMLEAVQPSAIFAAPFNMVGNGVINVADNTLNRLDATLVNGTNKVSNTLTTATGNIRTILTTATGDVNTILTTATTDLDGLVNAADATLVNGTARIANTLTHATADLGTAVNTLVNTTGATITNGGVQIRDVLTNATTDLGTAVNTLVDTADTAIVNGGTRLNNAITQTTNNASNVINNCGNNVVNSINNVVGNAVDAATSPFEMTAQKIGIKLLRTGVPYLIGTAAIAAILVKTYSILKGTDSNLQQPVFLATSADKQIGLWQRFKNLITRHEEVQAPTELIFAPAVQNQLDAVTQLTVNTFCAINKQNSSTVHYEPILLYGSSGTGKTSVAKKMANDLYQQTNGKMAWGYTTGALVLEHGIKGIDAMFAWAKKHNAACIVIDDADVLQSSPNNASVVNHLLYNMNEQANNCVVIMATTQVDNLSGSIRQRLANNSIQLPLPDEIQRAQVLKLSRDRIINNATIDPQLKTSLTEQLNDNKINEIASKTAKLSNADLHNVINKIVNSSGKEVSHAIIDTVVAEYLRTHATIKTNK